MTSVLGRVTPTIVLVGASAGGLPAVQALLAALPESFPAPVVVAHHLARRRPSHLAEILDRHVAVQVHEARERVLPVAGTVHLAPADHDLHMTPDRRLSLTPCLDVQLSCPSIDRLLTSVGEVHGAGTVAVVLSGTGTDGARGVVVVGEAGGTVVAEDEQSAEFGGMPQAARETGHVDLVLPAHEIGPRLTTLAVQGRAA